MGDHNQPGRDPSDETQYTGELGSEATEADEAARDRPDPIEATLADECDKGQETEVDVAGFDSVASRAGGVDSTLGVEAEPARSQRAVPSVAGYEIRGELGRGSMGVVYLARQLRLDRACALKMILAGVHADAIASRRFLVEAQAVARLRHSNVVQIYHIGEADGLPFFELEYLDGGSLDQRLDGTPWPPRRAARLVEELTRGI